MGNALKILVLDEDHEVTESVGTLLAQSGYDVTLCHRGPKALGYLENRIFDIFITDVNLSEIGGINILDWVSKNRPGIAVIAMSKLEEYANKLLVLLQNNYHFNDRPIHPGYEKVALSHA